VDRETAQSERRLEGGDGEPPADRGR
jgi:hypothetical protein